jgi:DNA-binding NarL/FixJ family response regulator
MTPSRQSRAKSFGAPITDSKEVLIGILHEIAQATASFGRPAATLSGQELTIVHLLLGGDSKAQVARKLSVSEYAVKRSLQRIREKWTISGPSSEVEERLMNRTLEAGLIEPSTS